MLFKDLYIDGKQVKTLFINGKEVIVGEPVSNKTLIFYNDGTPTREVDKEGTLTWSDIGKTSWPQTINNIVKIQVGSKITAIDQQCFYRLTNLNELLLPEGLLSINCNYQFDGTKITDLNIPSTVSSINPPANILAAGSTLSSITVAAGNQKYDSRDNCDCLVESSTNNVLVGCKSVSFPLPSTITSIGNDALNTLGFTSIDLGDNITTVGNNAFGGNNITTLNIPSQLTSIGLAPWRNCQQLTSITVDSGNPRYEARGNSIVEKSTNTVVQGCKNSQLDNTIEKLGQYSFTGPGLTSLVCPASLTCIDQHAFDTCQTLQSINLNDGLKRIEQQALYFCSNNAFTYVKIPSSVEYIGTWAFWYAQKLISVDMTDFDNPASIPTLNNRNAFDGNAAGRKFYFKDNRMLNAFASANNWNQLSNDFIATLSYDIADCDIDFQKNWMETGSAITPAVTVKNTIGETLVNGTDYEVAYSDNTLPGEATITITGIGLYSGTNVQHFNIYEKSIENCVITGIEQSYVHTGDPIYPVPTVTSPVGEVLVEDVDYSVSYGDNTEIGNGTVTITGITWSDYKTITFNIINFAGLTITALEPNSTIAMTKVGSAPNVSLEYSTDGDTWNDFIVGQTTVTLQSEGDKAFFRAGPGGNTRLGSNWNTKNRFTLTGQVSVSGNLMSLLDADMQLTTISQQFAFHQLFNAQTAIKYVNLYIGAQPVGQYCCTSLFEDCSGIISAEFRFPENTVLGNSVLSFSGQRCTSMTDVKITNATLSTESMYQLFQNASSLSSIEVDFTSWHTSGTKDGTYQWVSGVSPTGTFYCPSALGTNETIQRGINRCPAGWTVVNTDA